ncbi:hypothetical protein [Candidatus Methanarcanum hacksteinii]|uniref:hypothetical protein n=1 Tax=Candidatus Methanarcanum hacksteinii TaxID=2911857 RepID=UPI0037DC8D71
MGHISQDHGLNESLLIHGDVNIASARYIPDHAHQFLKCPEIQILPVHTLERSGGIFFVDRDAYRPHLA